MIPRLKSQNISFILAKDAAYMKNRLSKRIRSLPLWFWTSCMIAGGVCSVKISRAEIRPFYAEVSRKEEGTVHLSCIREKAAWQPESRSEYRLLSEGQSRREEVFDGAGIWNPKDLRVFRNETDSPDRLNSAFYCEGGTPCDDVSESVAGRIYKALWEKDSEWIHAIYSLGQIPPKNMALRLGAPDPNISEWNRINVTFRNGDRVPISGYSNAKEILSMVSVYSYFHEIKDPAFFRSYGDRLWNNSHAYTMSMSDVYYCQGECRYIEKDIGDEELAVETAVRHAEEEESPGEDDRYAGESGTAGDNGAGESSLDGETGTAEGGGTGHEAERGSAEVETGTAERGSAGSETGAAQSSEAGGEAETGTAQRGSADSESSSDEEETGTAQKGSVDSESSSDEETAETSKAADLEDVQESGNDQENGLQAQSSAENATPLNAARAVSQNGKEEKACKGHVDLNISVSIIGLKGSRNLYSVDFTGSKKGTEDSLWSGWDETARSYVQTIAEQDWYDRYGLTGSDSMYVRNPLSASEVEAYLAMIPPGTSPQRREIVKQALMSVGCIPYYWGGKPSAGGFEGNGFGTVVPADEDGRVLRGLDCSGWINWVYWTALGERLPYESTAGLMGCGREVAKEDLQAGDILIRGGEERHVYMFLAWAGDGSMYLIHETTGTVNNVTINTYDLDLPYYRSLVTD